MKEYNDKSSHNHAGKSTENFLDIDAILNVLDISSGQTILDAGCGNGYMAKRFAEKVGQTGKIYALDPHESSINLLKTEIQDTVIEAFIGDITRKTKIEESAIDMVYISTVIHGFSEDEMNGFIEEVFRVLKPKGKLAVLEIKKEQTPFGPPLELRFSPEELKQIIRLKPVKTVNVGEYFYLQVLEK